MQRFFKKRGITAFIKASELAAEANKPPAEAGDTPPAEDKKTPPPNYERVSFFVSIMMSLGVIFSIVNSWETWIFAAYLNDPWSEAAFNLNQTEVLSQAEARQNYTVYSYYLMNKGLGDRLGAEITDFEDPQQAELVSAYDEAQALAFSNRYFFPGNYLNPDGSYNFEQNVQASQAEMRRKLDTDPNAHRDYAYEQIERRRIFLDGSLILAFSVGLLGFEKLFYWERRWVRYLLIIVGTALLLIGMVNYLIHDPNPLLFLGFA